jgi:HEAT repeats
MHRIIIIFVSLLSITTSVSARVTAIVSIKKMFTDADVVIRANILDVKDIGKAKFSDSDLKDESFKYHVAILGPTEDIARVKILRLIKGELKSDTVNIHFYSSKSGDLLSLLPGENAILFLKKRHGDLFLFDIDNGKFPATKQKPHSYSAFPDAKARFIDELRLMTADSDTNVVNVGLEGLSQFPEIDSHDIFLKHSKDKRSDVRAQAIAVRMRSGETVTGKEMLDELQSDKFNTQSSPNPQNQRTRMFFMSGIDRVGKARDLTQVKTLLQLVDHKARGIRLSAIQALRRMRDPEIIPTFVRLIDDPDKFVQYLAVMTLCEMNSPGGKGKGCPSTMLFDKSPDKYKTQWKAWWVKENSNQK